MKIFLGQILRQRIINDLHWIISVSTENNFLVHEQHYSIAKHCYLRKRNAQVMTQSILILCYNLSCSKYISMASFVM